MRKALGDWVHSLKVSLNSSTELILFYIRAYHRTFAIDGNSRGKNAAKIEKISFHKFLT